MDKKVSIERIADALENIEDLTNELPGVDTEDAGKVLTVSEAGEWEAAAVPGELPAVAGNAGKVLKVNSGATGVEWDDESTELPAVTSSDEGDVLTVNASGQWAKAAPSGGKELKTITFDVLSYTEDNETYYYYEANTTNNQNLDSDIKAYCAGTCDMIFLFNSSIHGFGADLYYHNPDFFDEGEIGVNFLTPPIGIARSVMDSTEMISYFNDGVYLSVSINIIH